MSEATDQKEIVAWFRDNYPDYQKCLRVSMNGAHYGRGAKAARKWAIMKSQGAVEGESDFMIALPRGGFGSLLVEYKTDENTTGASKLQIEYVQFHNSVGNCACVAKGINMAKAAITQYMQG